LQKPVEEASPMNKVAPAPVEHLLEQGALRMNRSQSSQGVDFTKPLHEQGEALKLLAPSFSFNFAGGAPQLLMHPP
jgi:hypothetical protein